MVPFPALVTDQRELAPKVFRLSLRPAVSVADAAPGQFFMVGVSDSDDPLLRRPLSFLSAADQDGKPSLTLIYEVRGRGTLLLSSYQPGRSVSLIGPLGHGFDLNPPPRRAILVGGGIGAVPLYSSAVALKAAGADVTFIYGARTGDLLFLASELAAICARNLVCTDDGCQGRKAFTTDLLEEELREPRADQVVLACGPRPMLRRTAELCREYRTPLQVSLEARMACGMGACLTCAVRGASGKNVRVCKEGPVFDAAGLNWEALDDQA